MRSGSMTSIIGVGAIVSADRLAGRDSGRVIDHRSISPGALRGGFPCACLQPGWFTPEFYL